MSDELAKIAREIIKSAERDPANVMMLSEVAPIAKAFLAQVVIAPGMSAEYDRAVELANRILDRQSEDPDDDLAVLSRQFLRQIERTNDCWQFVSRASAIRMIGSMRERIRQYLGITEQT